LIYIYDKYVPLRESMKLIKEYLKRYGIPEDRVKDKYGYIAIE